jgi:phage gp29-like protein
MAWWNFTRQRNNSETGQKPQKNLNSYTSPSTFPRVSQDLKTFRDAIADAEQAWYPQRYKLQQLLNDTALNGHIMACMERRKDLTLLRDWEVEDSESTEELLDSDWFRLFISYALDGLFYGYNLISLGSVENNAFPYLGIVKRENISPDRYQVVKFPNGIDGANFLEQPFKNWHVWISTPSTNAQSSCGLGLLTYCAPYEIYLRKLSGWNATFLEQFAQPYRVGRTNKTNEDERAELEQALVNMGSNGWAILDDTDIIEFLETSLGNGGGAGYESFEKRCEEKISKIILGHANAMDEQSGKLGASQGEDNPVYKALRDKQVKDGLLIEDLVNKELFPRMRAIGFMIPETAVFKFNNDEEKESYRRKVDESNKVTAEIAQIMSSSGLQMDAAYFSERTGIPTAPIPTAKDLTNNIKTSLNKIYNHKCKGC